VASGPRRHWSAESNTSASGTPCSALALGRQGSERCPANPEMAPDGEEYVPWSRWWLAMAFAITVRWTTSAAHKLAFVASVWSLNGVDLNGGVGLGRQRSRSEMIMHAEQEFLPVILALDRKVR
jgi:hypothetical protein